MSITGANALPSRASMTSNASAETEIVIGLQKVECQAGVNYPEFKRRGSLQQVLPEGLARRSLQAITRC